MVKKIIFSTLLFLNFYVLAMEVEQLNDKGEKSLLDNSITEILTRVIIANTTDYDVNLTIRFKNKKGLEQEVKKTITKKANKILGDAKELKDISSIKIEMVNNIINWLYPIKPGFFNEKELEDRFWRLNLFGILRSKREIYLQITVSPDKDNIKENIFFLSYPLFADNLQEIKKS